MDFNIIIFFKEALNQISNKLNKIYDHVDIMSYNTHNSFKENMISCKKYADSLQDYLNEIGYNSNIICNSNIDDFATLFYAPAVISTSSSFSFMSGFFGHGILISTEHEERKKCDLCDDFILYGYNLKHEFVNDYYDTDNVISILKKTKYVTNDF